MQDLQNHEGKDIYVSISEPKSIRSEQQNKYYWGVVLDILSKEIGYETDEWHELLKNKFLSREMVVKNEAHVVGSSTTKLTTKGMEGYLEQIRRWAATELSISIPLPNEIDYETLEIV